MNTSLKKFSIVLKQEGTSRQDRYLPALYETGTLLDDRKLQNIILYMQEYAKNVLFVNADKDHVDYEESWEEFFGNDPVLLIAGVASLNTKKIKEEYDHLSSIFQDSPTTGNFTELVNFVFSRFFEINNWYTLSPSDSMLFQDLHLYIPSYLQKEMEIVKEMLLYCFDHLDNEVSNERIADIKNKSQKSIRELQSMNALWKLDQKERLSSREKIFTGNDEKVKLINASVLLNKIFETVFYTTETICEKSGKYFNETIHHKKNHNPHVALIIAFIELFGYEQSEFNKIPQRLLKYYYSDFLRIKEKGAMPDKAYIVFELAKGFDTCPLKKGTRLSAGKDKQNKELVYETDKDIVLNKAMVSSLRTAFIDRKENGETLNYYTDVVTQTPGQVEASSPDEIAPSKMFGSQNPATITEIGFAIASSQFYLAKGERNVVITLNTLGDIGLLEKTQGDDQTGQFNTGIIRLLLTGEKGWISSEQENSGIKINSLERISNSIIELNFSISIAQQQAIVAFNKKLHDGNFNTSFPLMKCILQFPSETEDIADADKRIHQLNILQKLQVDAAGINVHVGNTENKISFDGLRDLILENDESVLDNKKPFYPFTPVPKVSSSFYIGCSDLFYKEIQNLSINIEWLLPDNFNSYYQKYNPPYDSNKFIASLNYLEGNQWKKSGDVSLININTTEPRFRTIKFSKTTETPDPQDEIPTFDNSKKNGTIRLKLRYPDFGHGIYPQLITSTVMDKATGSGNIDFYKLLKKKLSNDIFTIELPPDIKDKNGPLKVMYDILERVTDDAQARIMMINVLSDIIGKHNNMEIISRAPGQPPGEEADRGSHIVVHDERLIERVFRVFRRLTILSDDARHAQDVKDEEKTVKGVDEDVSGIADFILPSKNEMNSLIVNEITKAINKTVANSVDRILAERAEKKTVDPNATAKILDEEFGKSKKVINDMIAKKIAVFLSANEIPPPPYSPLINTISLNYSSSKKMSHKDGDKIFHLTATGGVVETNIWKDDLIEDIVPGEVLYNTNFIIPQPLAGITQDSPDTYMQGMLFIGIKDAILNGNLSLLFQIAVGTKINDKKPPPLFWYYLRHNEWVNLNKDNIISDSTYDLQTTGIIVFSLPADADNLNTFFNTASQYWLCAGVASYADGFPYLIDVKAQAVGVTFVDYRNNPQHLALPMEAQKIKTIIDDIPQIKKIKQPESSFNGKLGEKENEYYLRVSERLRHKSRAINNWDYESLVLEHFPSFFKVKCLNNYCNGHFAVGHVTIVPIADLRNKNYAGSNMLMPKTNYIDLRKIEDFLACKSSPFVKIHAINPKLEQVLIKCKVKFNKGEDKGFCLRKLNEDLVIFLTPWATDPGKVSFSGKIYSSSIINFIDKRPYVDYVMDLLMFQYTENDKGIKEFVFTEAHLASLVETQLTTDHSILVSAPNHQIELVE